MDLSGATILLTGGTGSFGNAFVERVLDEWPDATIRVYSRDELNQSEMRARFGDRQVRSLPVDKIPVKVSIGNVSGKGIIQGVTFISFIS